MTADTLALDKILVPVDFSRTSELALEHGQSCSAASCISCM